MAPIFCIEAKRLLLERFERDGARVYWSCSLRMTAATFSASIEE